MSEREKAAQLKWLDPKYKSPKPSATSTVSTMPQLATDITSLHSSSETERNETINLTDIDSDANQSVP